MPTQIHTRHSHACTHTPICTEIFMYIYTYIHAYVYNYVCALILFEHTSRARPRFLSRLQPSSPSISQSRGKISLKLRVFFFPVSFFTTSTIYNDHSGAPDLPPRRGWRGPGLLSHGSWHSSAFGQGHARAHAPQDAQGAGTWK